MVNWSSHINNDYNILQRHNEVLQSGEKYCFITNKWEKLMGKIISTSITSVWKYHTDKQNKQRCQYLILWQTIRWEEIPPMSYARASPAVAASNGKIYAIGNATYRQYFRRPCKPIHIDFKIWCRVFEVLCLFYFLSGIWSAFFILMHFETLR